MCSKQHIKIKIFSARNVNVFWKKTRGAFCAGRDENMRQPVEHASTSAHTCRLAKEKRSSDGEEEALESPMSCIPQSGWLLAALSCPLALQQSEVCSSVPQELKEWVRRQPLSPSFL